MTTITARDNYENEQCIQTTMLPMCLIPEPINTKSPPDRKNTYAVVDAYIPPPPESGWSILDFLPTGCTTQHDYAPPPQPEFETPDIEPVTQSSLNAVVFAPVLSFDGRFVAYESAHSIVVHDRQLNSEEHITQDSDSYAPSISADGRFITFTSGTNNLVSGDHNNRYDIFLHDRQEKKTTRISVPIAGQEANGDSYMSAISADGQHVAFNSGATNLIPFSTDGIDNVFVTDRQTNKMARASISADGGGTNGGSGAPAISGDGGLVVFGSWATDLTPLATGGHYNIFLRNMITGAVKMLSIPSDGNGALNNDSIQPRISADGKTAAFFSRATNIVPNTTGNWWRIFSVDTETGQLKKCSNIIMQKGNDFSCNDYCSLRQFPMSADGRYLALVSGQRLSPDDQDERADIYVCDNKTGDIQLISQAPKGKKTIFDNIGYPSISGDGKSVVFSADTEGYGGFYGDIFVAKNPLWNE